ncbi:MAG: cell division protein FtsA [Patescibacteria group bacterium]|nr:cell division protein FtsA [Patescibacteria group bacterium]
MSNNHIVTGIDIGTDSLKALSVFKKSDSGELEVLTKVQSPSLGISKGVVSDVDEVSKRIQRVLSELEEQSGQKISDVIINIGGSHIFVALSHGTIVVSRVDKKISEEDIDRVNQAASAFPVSSNQEVLKVFPKEFIIDGKGGIKEPLGMEGMKLEVEVLMLCVFSPYLKKLIDSVLNAGFQVPDIVPSAISSANACLDSQQKELGAILIDIGAATTSIAVYKDGSLVHTAVFPVGSSNITYDIAIGLRTDIDVAEKVKKDFGSCMPEKSRKTEKIRLEDGEILSFSRNALGKIIGPRISEMFGLISRELEKLEPISFPAGVVITGGGAKLPKIVERAKKELELPVRIGTPKIIGLEKDSSWSVATGLVLEGFKSIEDEDKDTIIKKIIKAIKKIFKIFAP